MKYLKISISVLLLLAVLPMPYGYYTFLRLVSTIGFGIIGYNYYSSGNKIFAILSFGLMLLFQPLIKVYLSKPIWNAIDIIIGALLIVSVIVDKNKFDDNSNEKSK